MKKKNFANCKLETLRNQVETRKNMSISPRQAELIDGLHDVSAPSGCGVISHV